MDRQVLFGQLSEFLRGDERVRGLWLTGSTARGIDDAFSDLDLLAVVADDAFADFTAVWPSHAEKLLPLVYQNKLDFGRTVVSTTSLTIGFASTSWSVTPMPCRAGHNGPYVQFSIATG